MKKIIITIFIVSFFGILILLSQPRMRHIIYTGIVQFPEFAIMQSMRGGLVTRDFDRVLPWLDKQYELANYYGEAMNKMTPGLMENIKKAYNIAVLREEREKFIPLLEKTYNLAPNNIDLNIFLASAYQFRDKGKSLDYLNKARNILPSDERIYKLANILLRNSTEINQREFWCKTYHDSHFGDYEEYKNSSLLGRGYRRLALELDTDNQRNLFLNEGVQLGKKIKYEFVLGESLNFSNPSIRFSNGGGIKINFHNIELFSGGKIIDSYTNESIRFYPETGYVMTEGVISMNPLGENIYIELIPNSINHADKIVFELTIDKLKIDNTNLCAK